MSIAIEKGKIYLSAAGWIVGPMEPAPIHPGTWASANPYRSHRYGYDSKHLQVYHGDGSVWRKFPVGEEGQELVSEFEVQVGAYYVMGDGKIVGPMYSSGKETFGYKHSHSVDELRTSDSGSLVRLATDDEIRLLTSAVSEKDAKPQSTAPVVVEVGKFYVTKAEKVVGPMESEVHLDWLRSADESMSHCQQLGGTFNRPQVYLPNGSVADMADGEEDHVIVREATIAEIRAAFTGSRNFSIEEKHLYVTLSGQLVGPMVPASEKQWICARASVPAKGSWTGQQVWESNGDVWAAKDDDALDVIVRPATPSDICKAQARGEIESFVFVPQFGQTVNGDKEAVKQARLQRRNERKERKRRGAERRAYLWSEHCARQDVFIDMLKEEIDNRVTELAREQDRTNVIASHVRLYQQANADLWNRLNGQRSPCRQFGIVIDLTDLTIGFRYLPDERRFELNLIPFVKLWFARKGGVKA